MHILMIGHGAIAKYALHQFDLLSNDLQISVLCKPGREDCARDLFNGKYVIYSDIAEISPDIEIAFECAGHEALAAYGPLLLSKGIDVISVSTGALADQSVTDALKKTANTSGARLELVAGAVGAVDALSAASVGELTRLTYTAKKPPAGWKGSAAESKLDLDCLSAATCHFEGSAREAALAYPKNANVAATIAIAGLGLDDTEVRLIADPNISKNIHEVEAEGAFGNLSFKIEGHHLPGNPRSSTLTAMSVVRALRRRLSPIVI